MSDNITNVLLSIGRVVDKLFNEKTTTDKRRLGCWVHGVSCNRIR